jgi:hypothetical protein
MKLKNIFNINKQPDVGYTSKKFIDVYSFDEILPKKSRYKFKQSVNTILDALEDAGVDDTDIKKYLKELLEQAMKITTHSVFKDY